MKKDYYDTLWVTKWTSAADIKKAYKKLAMQWHPDRHQGDKKAETKFKEINEAYQTLSDTKKKQQYDTFGNADFNPWAGSGSRQQSAGFDFGDIFGNASRGQTRGWSQSFEFDLGDIFGTWGRKASSRSAAYEENLDMEQSVELPIWDFLLGTKISVDSPYSGKFRVTVPECTKPWTRLKVTGKGRTSGKKVGNLYLKLDARMPSKLTIQQRELLEKAMK